MSRARTMTVTLTELQIDAIQKAVQSTLDAYELNGPESLGHDPRDHRALLDGWRRVRAGWVNGVIR